VKFGQLACLAWAQAGCKCYDVMTEASRTNSFQAPTLTDSARRYDTSSVLTSANCWTRQQQGVLLRRPYYAAVLTGRNRGLARPLVRPSVSCSKRKAVCKILQGRTNWCANLMPGISEIMVMLAQLQAEDRTICRYWADIFIFFVSCAIGLPYRWLQKVALSDFEMLFWSWMLFTS